LKSAQQYDATHNPLIEPDLEKRGILSVESEEERI
jgi:hypothetical protein